LTTADLKRVHFPVQYGSGDGNAKKAALFVGDIMDTLLQQKEGEEKAIPKHSELNFKACALALPLMVPCFG